MDRPHAVGRRNETRVPVLQYGVNAFDHPYVYRRRTLFLLQLVLFVLEVIKQADSGSNEERRSSRREHLQDRIRHCFQLVAEDVYPDGRLVPGSCWS